MVRMLRGLSPNLRGAHHSLQRGDDHLAEIGGFRRGSFERLGNIATKARLFKTKSLTSTWNT
jgi:hypothetical protein